MAENEETKGMTHAEMEAVIVKVVDQQQAQEPPGTFSRQIMEDPFTTMYESGDAIQPPYAPTIWAAMPELSTILTRAVSAMKVNVAGLGWQLKPIQEIETSTPAAEKTAIEQQIAKANILFEYPNETMPFTELMENVVQDREATGNGYMEIVRDGQGAIASLFHIPAQTVRVRKGGQMYIQIRGTTKIYFKKFGDPRVIDCTTGEEAKAELPEAKRATELLHFSIYSPRSDYYGIPRYVAAATAIMGNKAAAEFNVAFFRNDATPRIMILVENGRLESKSIEALKQFMQTGLKGAKNAHRALVLQTSAKQSTEQSKGGIKVEKITVGNNEDASFSKYREMNDQEIKQAFGIADMFYGAGEKTYSRASAQVVRQVTNEQIFIPEQRKIEYRINHTILVDMECDKIKLVFQAPKETDELGESELYSNMASAGGITPNDVRNLMRKPKFQGDWADIPLAVYLARMNLGLANGTVGIKSLEGQLMALKAMVDTAKEMPDD